jgi:glycerol kinase
VTAVLAIDQGTTGSTALVVDVSGKVLSRAYREVAVSHPLPGWVQQDANELFDSARAAARQALAEAPE